jgi:hypothetical protein
MFKSIWLFFMFSLPVFFIVDNLWISNEEPSLLFLKDYLTYHQYVGYVLLGNLVLALVIAILLRGEST